MFYLVVGRESILIVLYIKFFYQHRCWYDCMHFTGCAPNGCGDNGICVKDTDTGSSECSKSTL